MLFELEAMSTAELFLLPPTPKEKKLNKTVLATFASYEQTPTQSPTPPSQLRRVRSAGGRAEWCAQHIYHC